ncbi:FAD-dependent monooxygenase [Kribbella deserti]|uniref:FAD-dependent monooxygenase n=1 Tax=Kribbella deserti TaxID=1926257 RepID=A0ABV6QN24_9ACTN
MTIGEQYDAVVVGARCAGSVLAARLAAGGGRILLIDRDRFPSDTVSTHVMFPNTLDRLDRLGVMDRLRAAHDLSFTGFSWRVLGHEVAGDFTPIGGYDRACSVRRVVLDAALATTAVEAGAELRTETTVTQLIGAGTADDPVRGVVLNTGERVGARWVFGADGRLSTVARRLGVAMARRRKGEMAFLLAYWRGLPSSEWCHIDLHEQSALMSVPCEDGIHLLSLAAGPDVTRGTAADRERRYREGIRRFPAVLNPRLLDLAERVSGLIAVPETMLRGHYRKAAGAGWALLGDAGHFKHPATAQGIGDAVEQALYIADHVTSDDDLTGYNDWRDAQTGEQYEWSFGLARFNSPRAAAVYAGLAADEVAGQDFRDVFTKSRRPSQISTPQRLSRWNLAWAYQDGLCRLRSLMEDDGAEAFLKVPACPDWTVGDLLAHLVGMAEDVMANGAAEDAALAGFAVGAWRSPALARQRDRWTAEQVARRAGWDLAPLLRDLDERTSRLLSMLRRGVGLPFEGPEWLPVAPVADLAVHLEDLREVLGVEGAGDEGAVTRLGFAIYRNWLSTRIVECGLPPLQLSDGADEWLLGADGMPAAAVVADRNDLFRMITGRRTAAQIRGFQWQGDPSRYLSVISPYGLRSAGESQRTVPAMATGEGQGVV